MVRGSWAGLRWHIGLVIIAGYVEQLLAGGMAKPSVKQHRIAIRMILDAAPLAKRLS